MILKQKVLLKKLFNYRILRDQTGRLLDDKEINKNCNYVKLTKMLDLLARPRGFEPLTLGLEMGGIGYTNDIVLHRFVILQ